MRKLHACFASTFFRQCKWMSFATPQASEGTHVGYVHVGNRRPHVLRAARRVLLPPHAHTASGTARLIDTASGTASNDIREDTPNTRTICLCSRGHSRVEGVDGRQHAFRGADGDLVGSSTRIRRFGLTPARLLQLHEDALSPRLRASAHTRAQRDARWLGLRAIATRCRCRRGACSRGNGDRSGGRRNRDNNSSASIHRHGSCRRCCRCTGNCALTRRCRCSGCHATRWHHGDTNIRGASRRRRITCVRR